MNSSILYISYDGMLEPLGQSQVLAYLNKLAGCHQVYLLSFEKKRDWQDQEEVERLRQSVNNAGIRWYPLRYHKRPSALATAFDIVQGLFWACGIALRHRIKIVHARSYVAAVMAFFLKKIIGVKFLFDMRGFWADERVDAGLWSRSGGLYRTAKWFERKFLLEADKVISLTHAGVVAMRKFSYLQNVQTNFEVITTCTDLELFHPLDTEKARTDDASFTLGWVGAVRGWYLFDEALIFFQMLRRKKTEARLCILNRENHEYILQRLTAHNVPMEVVQIKSVPRTSVPAEMAGMDAGIFFIMPVFSKLASAPTKLGEFLGCGIPCVANEGVGDMTSIITGESVGVVVNDFDESKHEEAVDELLALCADNDIRQRCMVAAERHFSLDAAVATYSRIYSELAVGK